MLHTWLASSNPHIIQYESIKQLSLWHAYTHAGWWKLALPVLSSDKWKPQASTCLQIYIFVFVRARKTDSRGPLTLPAPSLPRDPMP